MFVRKHYKAMAEIVKKQVPFFGKTHGSYFASKAIAEDMAAYFAEDNPRFDRTKFLLACGVE